MKLLLHLIILCIYIVCIYFFFLHKKIWKTKGKVIYQKLLLIVIIVSIPIILCVIMLTRYKLPKHFQIKTLATSGTKVKGINWHYSPDGGNVFESGDNTIYVSNSEVLHSGGCNAIVIDNNGEVIDAYNVLNNTSLNCAGGKYGDIWWSCEEIEGGYIWQTYPKDKSKKSIRLDNIGTGVYEAVTYHKDTKTLYITEDKPDGNLFKYTPFDPNVPTKQGVKYYAKKNGNTITWEQMDNVNKIIIGQFNGPEGIDQYEDKIYFATKGDNHVWEYDTNEHISKEGNLKIIYDGSGNAKGLDNVFVDTDGNIWISEDGDDMELNIMIKNKTNSSYQQPIPFLRLRYQYFSELTGPALDHDMMNLYFSSQRGYLGSVYFGRGITYRVHGNFKDWIEENRATT
jgi:uncharacterized protein